MKGSVYKRTGSKAWTVAIDVGQDEHGKRIRKLHSGYPTKRAAEEARIEILSKLATGEYVPPNKVTVRQWLGSWLPARQIADTTRAAYEVDVRRLVEGLGNRRLRDLTPVLVSNFYAELAGQGLAPKTIRNTHSTFHRALADAVRQGVVPRNVSDHVELPRIERPEMKTWTADELRRFLEHAKSQRLFAAFLLMCSTGARRSEILGSRWSSFDAEHARLSIVDTVVLVNHQPVLRLGETKSRRSRRVVALDERVVAVLRAHRSRQNEERLVASSGWHDLDLVFTDEMGGIVSPDWFTRTTKRLAVEAGVPPLTPHATRHTWATLALEAGIHPKVVQERLGHSSIAITMDLYSHVTEGMDRDAAETVAKLFV